jgi:hypothetical protein
MKPYLVLAAILLAANSSIAAAQSSTATSGTTAPMVAPMPSAPVAGNAGTAPAGQNKVVIPPAARSGEKGLRVGNDAVGDPIEIKRRK